MGHANVTGSEIKNCLERAEALKAALLAGGRQL
jgi:hypothetical protein